MNWFYSLIVFQFTILLLHGRPETTTSTSTTTKTSPEQITLKIEHHHSSSVPSSIVQNSEGNGPSSPSPSAIVNADSTKKQSATTAAVSTPVQTTKRVLSTTIEQLKKSPPSKKIAKLQESTISVSTAAGAQDSTAKPTRYTDKNNRTHTIMHANQINVNAKHFNNTSNKLPLLNNNNNKNNNNTISNLRELRQRYVNGLNRQYLGNVYNVNPYIAQLLTTPKPSHTFLSSAPQQTYFIVHPDDLANFEQLQQNNVNLANVGNLGNIFNVGTPINTNLVSTVSASESYQLPRPPSPPPLTVNIPYHEFPTQSSYPPPSQTSPLFHSANITKLYSIIGTSTPDPYTDYQEVQLKPGLYGQKVVKYSVTTHRPYRPNNRYGNGQHKRKPINHTNKNNQNFNQNHGNKVNSDSNQNGVNKISIVYNESSQFFNANNNPNKPTDNLNVNAKNESLSQTKSKECLVTPSAGNVQNENVCNSNDLKIIIKFDGSSVANATEKNAVKPKPKKKKTVIMTTTTSTAAAPYYDSLSYESDETSEESNELAGFFEPLQNLFGLMESTSLERRRRRKRPPKRKEGHKKKSGEVVNKYQTIILQTPSPPTTSAAPMKGHKSMLYKLFAILSMIAVLKPLGFGLWTLVLSPLLVITLSGVALGVILYPFLVISKKQEIQYGRSPRVVIHKRPRPRPRPVSIKPIAKRPVRPAQLGPGHVIAKWTASERRRIDFSRNTHANAHKIKQNHRRRPQQHQRFIPIRLRNMQSRSKRHTRDTEFQQWLLIQNNFNIRIMSPNHDYDYDY